MVQLASSSSDMLGIRKSGAFALLVTLLCAACVSLLPLAAHANAAHHQQRLGVQSQYSAIPQQQAAYSHAAAAPSADSVNLIDLLSASPNHTLFLGMLQRTRLIPTLNRLMLLGDGRGLTIFAPTDTALLKARDEERAARLAAGAASASRSSPSARGLWELAVEDAQQQQSKHDVLLAQAAEPMDNIHARLRSQLLYHMLNYTLPYNLTSTSPLLGDEAVPLPKEGHPDMHTTLHLPSRRVLHTPTRPGPVPQPPSDPPHPGAEDEGGLLGGEGQKLRLGWRVEKGKAGALWIGTDTKGNGGAEAVAYDGQSSNGLLVSIEGVLQLPPDLEAALNSHPALAHLVNLSSPALLNSLCETAHTTFFLPTAAAFDVLSPIERTFLRGKWELAAQDRVKLLGWHMSGIGIGGGKVGYAERLRKKGTNITTILGGQVPVQTAADGTILIDHAKVVEEDILTENGVIHIVDKLLLPGGTFGMTVEKTLLALNASRFVGLMHTAGLSSYIDADPRDPDHEGNKASWTFMVPRDDVLDGWMQREANAVARTASRWGQAAASLDEDDDDWKGPPTNGSRLIELLRYHIAPGQLTPAKLDNGQLIGTELRDWKLKEGRQRIVVEVTESAGVKHQGNGDVAFGDANVIAEPVLVGNNIIYLISQLLQPPLNPIQTAVSSLSLSTFVATVFSADLDKPIKRAPGITYLVPHNDAFAAMGLAMQYLLLAQPESREELRSVVEYHAVDQIVYMQDFAKGSTRYPTLEGSPIWAGRSSNGTIEVRRGTEGRNARVIRGDILTSTGVLHEIDQVEMPPDIDLTIGKLMRGAKAETMRSLVKQAGYGWILNGTAPPSPEVAAELDVALLSKPGGGQGNHNGKHGKRGEKKRHKQRHNLFADAEQSYVVLCPTDAAFARVNLSYYLGEPEVLKRLVQLHIIPSPADEVLPGGTADRLPLALKDSASFPTLLDRSLGGFSSYGRIGFRRNKNAKRGGLFSKSPAKPGGGGDEEEGNLGWVVGVEGTRGSDGKSHSANVVAFGRESLSSNRADEELELVRKRRDRSPTPIEGGARWNSRSVGGVLTIDAVLQPYVPGWFYRWGWIVLVVIMVSVVLASMSYGLWMYMTKDGRIRLPEALEGEED